MSTIPQNVDLQFVFENIMANTSPTTIDLSTLDDIVLSVSKNNPNNDPTLIIKYSISPGSFDIDNTNKTITITVTSSDIGTDSGQYYVNLWLVENSRYITHLSKPFYIENSVAYTA
ncbi:MAG: hypothetical protein BAJALOKI3v1_50136 [Promethearchaeota archaeon]|nr:MAG: hypothetical protein BAJALOKI3v1_50136 [Candidatus Lokiarchaeota archaeon]